MPCVLVKMRLPMIYFVYPLLSLHRQIAERGQLSTTKAIHFIVPLAGRYETLKRFLNNFDKVCLATGENVKLLVVLFKVSFGLGLFCRCKGCERRSMREEYVVCEF